MDLRLRTIFVKNENAWHRTTYRDSLKKTYFEVILENSWMVLDNCSERAMECVTKAT